MIFSDQIADELIKRLSMPLPLGVAIRGLVSKRTFWRWIKAGRKGQWPYVDFAKRHDEIASKWQSECVDTWINAAKTDWQAARALLLTRDPRNWAPDRYNLGSATQQKTQSKVEVTLISRPQAPPVEVDSAKGLETE